MINPRDIQASLMGSLASELRAGLVEAVRSFQAKAVELDVDPVEAEERLVGCLNVILFAVQSGGGEVAPCG